ncbi:MAG: glycosyltransferase [Candidatus Omnitrophica bacterium]|nr:glycosyltransferase [Candidatus Omnitrophota bacterium]
MELSVVIPAFNEEKRLPQTLEEIRPYLDSKGWEYEVIVVDDGSRDRTVELCREKATAWKQLRCLVGNGHAGKGACVKRGGLTARGENILIMDADHATPIDSLEFFMPQRKTHEIIVGVRAFCGQEGASGKGRRIIGLIQQLMAHMIVFKSSVADSQCGFKLFSKKAVQQVFPRLRIGGGMYDVEIFLIAQKHGIPLFSQPVRWVNKEGSTINIPQCMIFDPLSLLRIRALELLGKYD